jgi:putative endonuclease
MTNKHRTTLYIGVTNNLQRRVEEHRTHNDPYSFTAKYNVEYCIYYEHFPEITQAICREKQLKKWRRAKKDALISAANPEWNDLFPTEAPTFRARAAREEPPDERTCPGRSGGREIPRFARNDGACQHSNNLKLK